MPLDRDGVPPIPFRDDPEGAESEDILDIGRDRRTHPVLERWANRFAGVPRMLQWVAAVGFVLVVGTGYLLLQPRADRLAQLPGSAARSGQQSADDDAIDMVAAAARDSQPLSSYIRSSSAPGSCVQVPVRAHPQQDLVRAVHVALPGYSLRDVGRTLDQFTAMCTLELRATDAQGSTLVVIVVSPASADWNPFDQLIVASRSKGTAVISIVSSITRPGWMVTVGAVGQTYDQPTLAVMLHLAQDPSLRW